MNLRIVKYQQLHKYEWNQLFWIINDTPYYNLDMYIHDMIYF